MIIKDLMTKNVATCRPGDHASDVGRLMLEKDCGLIPVTDEESNVVGVVTDRDLCLALVARDCRPSDLVIREIMSSHVWVCSIKDSIDEAIRIMGEQQIRRLPVIDDEGKLCGLISMNDLILGAANLLATDQVEIDHIFDSLNKISSHKTGYRPSGQIEIGANP